MTALEQLGWTPQWQATWDAAAVPAGAVPGRVVRVERLSYQLAAAGGTHEAVLPGGVRHKGQTEIPVIGDWTVAVRDAEDQPYRILSVLPRQTTFSRAVSGGGRVPAQQVMAANVDTVFVVTAPDEDFDLARLGRYVTAVRLSGAQPVVLLNKADLARDLRPYTAEAEALDVPVHAVQARAAGGLEALEPYLGTGQTVALIGSSGVGKSTLTNALLGRAATPTGEVRELDNQGRHTTTWRTLYPLPSGGLLIDNPGLRDIAIWDETGEAFARIEELAAQCRFSRCTHTSEPGCAVLRAMQRGEISEELLEEYREFTAPGRSAKGKRPKRAGGR
ncbi:ribosome small subunit-dependent GTPase A [Deinococcus lacus]|uniref:Small ribosomal subunit biogenesis GTPase RsgA n=1 Tax=Deinococcus lacus TaxID=392561 RepID=A0ABW1YGE2_9DEIO